ncbi:MAG: hypothetical protein A2381_06525 [Bdellovibrionales bacterium RIFOXYB1_FULL_37_110]|nr:MAG: hypothetical protein A2181_08545 [Bdellovibrionales bacterium RIFOXYA1_FULL_38_20]OFZ50197.1 MAG: hypothetical protein A2417_19375 [Bdellovibrionales bacterium RIFOXYC1_FULL_37_79]OFZ57634.1 MAG: hypothetical protein A2381_06525 [Bdellovibrionales bacterium RIFOXYB1_FULL_37_110]OFZ61401.1 MAG: hypothetical protein A2577_00890 [Bdellovibrionales bacterium RIFOXYD1_FULL_36_51]
MVFFGITYFIAGGVLALEMPKDEVAVKFGEVKTFSSPQRMHAVIVSETGFYPDSIMLFRGEHLKLFVTGTTLQPSCLMIPSKEIFLAAEKGIITEGEVSFDQPGVYEFFCPSKRNIKGKIVVIEKKLQADKIKREVASKNKVKQYWYPKDDPGLLE